MQRALPVLLATVGLSFPAQAREAGSDRVMAALRDELGRAQTLTIDDFEPPYFVSYLLRDTERLTVDGKQGAVYHSAATRDRIVHADVRVGSYAFDSSGQATFTFSFDESGFDYGSLYNYVRAPVDDDPIAIRDALWLLTDYKYKEALQSYLQKKAKKVYTVAREKKVADLSREKKRKYRGPALRVDARKKRWESLVRDVGAHLKGHPEIFDSGVNVSVSRTTQYYINSEGTEVIFDAVHYSVAVSALTRAKDGTLLEGTRTFYARDTAGLPSTKRLETEVKAMVTELLETRRVPALPPYSGPAILLPRVTGVFFHEAVGHRLEGKRQRSDDEGQTFKGKVGERIIPTFLTVVDDPSLTAFEGTQLNGFYPYDDEGVPAESVTLVRKGVLQNYLMSRAPIEEASTSNGHGRNSAFEAPMARMANLVVRSDETVTPERLEEMLLAEVRKQKKPFGIIIEEIEGGETSTSRRSIQAFREIATKVWKIDATSGQKTQVRGVEFIGTPLTSINKILATSDAYRVFNGYCGAESGYIPVSTVAPAVLLSEIELQKAGSDRKKPPILPPPAMENR